MFWTTALFLSPSTVNNMQPTLFHKTGLISMQGPDDRSRGISQNLM